MEWNDTSNTTNSSNTPPGPPPFPPIPPLCYQDAYWTSVRVLVTFTFVLTVTSNLMLLLVTWRAARTRINSWLFASLAMSDLLTGVLVLPYNLVLAARAEVMFYQSTLCTVSGNLFHALQAVSLYSFFSLSLDRFLAIEFPLRYPSLVTTLVNSVNLMVIWGIPSLTYGMLPAAGLGIYLYKCWQCMCNLGMVDLTYLNFLLYLSVSIFVMTYILNGRILYVAHKQSSKIANIERALRVQSGGKKFHILDKMRAAKSIMTALSLFTLCWGPYYTALFALVLFGLMVSPLSQFLLLWLAISNGFMNFFVFLATYRQFRHTFLKMLGVQTDSMSTTIFSDNMSVRHRVSNFASSLSKKQWASNAPAQSGTLSTRMSSPRDTPLPSSSAGVSGAEGQ